MRISDWSSDVCSSDLPDIGICGSTLVYYATPERVQALGGGRYAPWFGRFRLDGFEQRFVLGRPAAAGLDFVHGASMFVSRAFVETVGLLDERYFLYFEELDWTARAGRRFRLGHAPDSVVSHKEGAAENGRAACRERVGRDG